MSNTSLPRTQSEVFRELLQLALPIIGLNVLSVLTLAVDTAMCGRLPNSENVLAALGFATMVTFLLMVAMIGLTVGTVALVARAFGAGDEERVNHIFQQASQLTILVGLMVGLIGIFFSVPILELIGAETHIAELGADYLEVTLGGTVFYYLSTLFAAILRGLRNTRLPFLVALVSNAVNVLVNYGLILGNLGMPSLGIRGAAIGTVIAHLSGVIILFVLLRRGIIPALKPSLKPAPLDRDLARTLIKIGTPAAADMVILNAGFLSIVGMLGTIAQIAVAAHGVGLRIQSLAFVPGMSVSQATGALVGNALGAGSAEDARKVVRSSLILCLGIMTTLAVIIILAVEPIIEIFDVSPSSELGLYSIDWVLLLGYGMPIVGIYIAFTGMLRGAGETNTSLKINVIGTVAFQIPLSYILGFPLGMGAYGVWLAFPLSFVLKAILAWWVYRRGRWIKLGMTPGDNK